MYTEASNKLDGTEWLGKDVEGLPRAFLALLRVEELGSSGCIVSSVTSGQID